MARRHANVADFELVGLDSDPTPGDPDLISGVLKRYEDIGDAAERALNVLRKGGTVASGRGSAMDKLAEMIGDDLPDKLNKTATSYHDAARAYRDYIPRLEEAQATFDQAVDQAQSAAPQAGQAAPAPFPPDATEDARAANRATEDAIDAAQGQLSAARSLAEQARSMRENAQRQASEVLDQAAGEAIPERNIFQKIADFFKEFPFVEILLGLLIAVVSVLFPVVGLLLGAALFLVTQIPAIASGNFQLGDFLIGLVGLIPGGSLLKGGAGLAKGGAELAEAAPKIVKAADGPLTSIGAQAGKTTTFSGLGKEIGKEAGKSFGEEAGTEGLNQLGSGDGFDVGEILKAGGIGAATGATGGLIGGRAGRGSGSSSSSGGTTGRPAGGGDGTRSLDGSGSGTGGSGDGTRAFDFDSGPTSTTTPPANLDPGHVADIQQSAGAGNPLQFRTDDGPLFRLDSRPPGRPDGNGIFAGGFRPLNPNGTDLPTFLDNNTPSDFISTTRVGSNVVFDLGPNNERVRFQFLIDHPGGIDIDATFPNGIPTPSGAPALHQNEVTFVGGVPASSVLGVRPVLNQGPAQNAFGSFVPNPNARPLSADELNQLFGNPTGAGTVGNDHIGQIFGQEQEALAERNAGPSVPTGADNASIHSDSSDSLGGGDSSSSSSSDAGSVHSSDSGGGPGGDNGGAGGAPGGGNPSGGGGPSDAGSDVRSDNGSSNGSSGSQGSADPNDQSFLDLDDDSQADPNERSFLDLDDPAGDPNDRSFLNLDSPNDPNNQSFLDLGPEPGDRDPESSFLDLSSDEDGGPSGIPVKGDRS